MNGMPQETTIAGAPAPANRWMDTPTRYGLVSRLLHWLTAALVMLQFAVVLTWDYWLGETPFTLLLAKIGPHGSVGTLILAVTLARALWALANRRRRPSHRPGLAGLAARGVHLSLYLLLALIPAMAILRQYGLGRPLWFYSVELIPATGYEVAWMQAPADLLHGPLSWLLLALIVGHVLMALIHRLWLRDAILSRLTGPLAPTRSG